MQCDGSPFAVSLRFIRVGKLLRILRPRTDQPAVLQGFHRQPRLRETQIDAAQVEIQIRRRAIERKRLTARTVAADEILVQSTIDAAGAQ